MQFINFVFDSFAGWKERCEREGKTLIDIVVEYERREKDRSEAAIWEGLGAAWKVMQEAVETGLSEDMKSRSGMIDNGAKKVFSYPTAVISPEFQRLVAHALAAKEVNACMGRVVAAPTAGASGIMPGTLYTMRQLHQAPDQKILEAMALAAGVALIIEQKASISGAVGGCQAETGSAAAMAAAAMTYLPGGTIDQIFNAVAIAIQCTLGLVCDPVAGLVEVPCVVRNASAAAIAASSAQIALSGVGSVIPVDEVVEAMGEIGANMKTMYKETALGGLAITQTAQAIAQKTLVQNVETLPDESDAPPEPA